MKPTFAVVIPVYNGADFLSQAIDSSLAQCLPADEIIILDDASTDATSTILGQYAQQFGERLRIERLSQRELAAEAWNQVVRRSSAEFVVVLAHDDLLHVDFLARAEHAIEEFPYLDLFISGTDIIDAKGMHQRTSLISDSRFALPGLIPREKFLDKFTCSGQFFLPSGTLFSRSLFERLGGFDPRIRVAYDWDFFLRAGSFANIYISDRALASYRHHEAQSIVGHTKKDNGDSDVIFDKLPRMGEHLSGSQRLCLVRNMCDFLRRFATSLVIDPSVPANEVVATRRQIAGKIQSWRTASNPFAKYVRTTPTHWRQQLMWLCASRRTSVHVARLLFAKRSA